MRIVSNRIKFRSVCSSRCRRSVTSPRSTGHVIHGVGAVAEMIGSQRGVPERHPIGAMPEPRAHGRQRDPGLHHETRRGVTEIVPPKVAKARRCDRRFERFTEHGRFQGREVRAEYRPASDWDEAGP